MSLEMELEKEKQVEDINAMNFFFGKDNKKGLTIEEKQFKKAVREYNIEEYELLKTYNFNRKWAIGFITMAFITACFGGVKGLFGASDAILFPFVIGILIFLGMFMKHSLYCSMIKKQRKVSIIEWLFSKELKIPEKIETYRFK